MNTPGQNTPEQQRESSGVNQSRRRFFQFALTATASAVIGDNILKNIFRKNDSVNAATPEHLEEINRHEAMLSQIDSVLEDFGMSGDETDKSKVAIDGNPINTLNYKLTTSEICKSDAETAQLVQKLQVLGLEIYFVGDDIIAYSRETETCINLRGCGRRDRTQNDLNPLGDCRELRGCGRESTENKLGISIIS